MKNKTIFAIVYSPDLRSAKFFATLAGARKELNTLANERKNKLGVHNFEQSNDQFSFLIGWEEHKITFSIIELSLQD